MDAMRWSIVAVLAALTLAMFVTPWREVDVRNDGNGSGDVEESSVYVWGQSSIEFLSGSWWYDGGYTGQQGIGQLRAGFPLLVAGALLALGTAAPNLVASSRLRIQLHAVALLLGLMGGWLLASGMAERVEATRQAYGNFIGITVTGSWQLGTVPAAMWALAMLGAVVLEWRQAGTEVRSRPVA